MFQRTPYPYLSCSAGTCVHHIPIVHAHFSSHVNTGLHVYNGLVHTLAAAATRTNPSPTLCTCTAQIKKCILFVSNPPNTLYTPHSTDALDSLRRRRPFLFFRRENNSITSFFHPPSLQGTTLQPLSVQNWVRV